MIPGDFTIDMSIFTSHVFFQKNHFLSYLYAFPNSLLLPIRKNSNFIYFYHTTFEGLYSLLYITELVGTDSFSISFINSLIALYVFANLVYLIQYSLFYMTNYNITTMLIK